jgi:hypothetical protein
LTDNLTRAKHVEKGEGTDEGFEDRRTGCGEDGKLLLFPQWGESKPWKLNGTNAMGK